MVTVCEKWIYARGLLTTGFLIVGARAVLGSTGKAETWFDVYGVIGASIVGAAFGWISWVLNFYQIDAFMARRLTALEIRILAATGVLSVLMFNKPSWWWFSITAGVALMNLMRAHDEPLTALADNNQPLERDRLVHATFLVWITALTLICFKHELAVLGVLTVGIG